MKHYRRQPANISLQLDNQQNLDFINQIHILKSHYLFKYLKTAYYQSETKQITLPERK